MSQYETRAGMIERFGLAEIQQLERNIVKGIAVNPDEQAALDAQRAATTENALADCSATADGYIASRNALPLATVPDKLKEVVAELARYKLMKDKSSDEVRQRYEDAMSWLKDVARGTVVLVIGSTTEPTGYHQAGSLFVV